MTAIENYVDILYQFEEFIGQEKVNKKLSSLDRLTESTRSTPGYFLSWIYPKEILWFAIKDIHKLINEKLDIENFMSSTKDEKYFGAFLHMKLILDSIDSMPESKKAEIRSILLKSDNWASLFHEMEIASFLKSKGYKISWYENNNEKHPELKASKDIEFNVECKALGEDTGQAIKIKDAIYLVENAKNSISEDLSLTGEIYIYFSKDINVSKTIKEHLLNDLLEGIKSGETEWKANGINYKISLGKRTSKPLCEEDTSGVFKPEDKKYQYKIPIARNENGKVVDPIVFYLGSEQVRIISKPIKENLRKAVEQLPDDIPGMIRYYIPEIELFDEDCIKELMNEIWEWFLKNETRKKKVFGIQFVSDLEFVHYEDHITTKMYRKYFSNPEFSGFLGDDLFLNM